MKTWIMNLVLVLVAGLVTLGLFPNSAEASYQHPLAVETLTPAPEVVQPVDSDFSDVEFATADQAELGARTGGDAAGLLISLVVLVLIVLLILWLINEAPVHSIHGH